MNKPRNSMVPKSLVSFTTGFAVLAGTAVAARAEDPPNTNWVSSLAVGFTLTSGNSDSVLGTAGLLSGRKWGMNELSLGVDGAYGKTTDHTVDPDRTTKSAELVHGFAQYNRLFNERLYGYGRVEAMHDGIALVRYRVSLSPGAGYYFIKEKATDLSGEVGPGYVWDNLGGDTRHYATIRFGEKFHQQLSDRARIWQTAEWLPQVEDFNNYIFNAEIGIEADLSSSKKFSLRCFVVDNYNNQPAAGRKQNDVKLVTALAYKF